ncbi:hypothetical protein YB2330_002838 [Saitoella coloradoensis]
MDYQTFPDANVLRKAFVGKPLFELPTPAFIVDRAIVKRNCDAMLKVVANSGQKVRWRAVVKTHKTVEVTRMQLGGHGSVVVSTLAEAWWLLRSEAGLNIDDVLYALPPVPSRLPELDALSTKIPHFRLMLDSEQLLPHLSAYAQKSGRTTSWDIFLKLDCGSNRAGLGAATSEFRRLVEVLRGSGDVVTVVGVYAHAGQSYDGRSSEEAREYLRAEVEEVNAAANIVHEILPSSCRAEELILSVGATPTAHAFQLTSDKPGYFLQELGIGPENVRGVLELHAGNYPFHDLQQLATGLITPHNLAVTVLADVASVYEARDEVLINAGSLALGREPGLQEWGYGKVVGRRWVVGRMSQEHGILVRFQPNESLSSISRRMSQGERRQSLSEMGLGEEEVQRYMLHVGDRVRIVPQHACISAAGYGWYYVVDGGVGGGEEVVDVWVPCKGW